MKWEKNRRSSFPKWLIEKVENWMNCKGQDANGVRIFNFSRLGINEFVIIFIGIEFIQGTIQIHEMWFDYAASCVCIYKMYRESKCYFILSLLKLHKVNKNKWIFPPLHSCFLPHSHRFFAFLFSSLCIRTYQFDPCMTINVCISSMQNSSYETWICIRCMACFYAISIDINTSDQSSNSIPILGHIYLYFSPNEDNMISIWQSPVDM